MPILRALTLLLAALCCVPGAARAEVPVPPLQARVTDLSGALDAQQTAALQAKLAGFERRSGSQIAVLILPGTAPETIEQYGIRVAEAWKLGRKGIDDGAILIVAKDEHRLRIEVGYGLEGALNDAVCARIIDETVVPRFKQGQFYEGIDAAVDNMIKVASGEALPAPEPGASARGSGDDGGAWIALLIIGSFVAASILRALVGRPLGMALTAAGAGTAAWFCSGVLTVALVFAGIGGFVALLGGSIFSGFGGRGGGFSGGYGGGSLSGGGFSGGGGSFGGGGASGSW